MNQRTLARLFAAALRRCVLGSVVLHGISGCTKQIEHGDVAFDISPDGQQLVFAAADGDLYLFNIARLLVSQLTRTPAKEKAPAFSPDGKSLIYAADRKEGKGSCLFVLSLEDKQIRQVTNDSATNDTSPSYSPDGSHIAFARAYKYRRYSLGGWTWDDWELCLMKSDGTGLKRLTREKYRGMTSPKFLTDGKRIIYSADRDRAHSDLTTTLYKIDVSGEPLRRPIEEDDFPRKKCGAWAAEPDVSNNGSIAFITDRVAPYKYDVFIMHPDGKLTPLGVTKVSRYNQQPTFLPDGRSLLFLAGQEWNAGSRPIFSLWQVGRDGKDPHRIAGSALFTDPLRWKPNQ